MNHVGGRLEGTALHYAVIKGSLEMLQLMLDMRPDLDVNAVMMKDPLTGFYTPSTALHVATR